MVAMMEFIRFDTHDPVPVRGRYAYSPSAAEVRRDRAGRGGGRFFQLLAEIEISGDARGVICAQQSSGGAYALFLRDGKLVFVHDAPGATRGERLDCDTPSYGTHVVGVEFTRAGTGHDARGTVTLGVDGRAIATAPVAALPTRLAPWSDGFWIGYDGRDGTTREYDARFPLAGARVIEIVVDACHDALAARPPRQRTPIAHRLRKSSAPARR